MTNNDVKRKVAESIIASMDRGVVPWRPLHGRGSSDVAVPSNFYTKNAYRGSNIWLLEAAKEDNNFTSSYWVTYKQAIEAGGHVRKGEKSKAFVIYANRKKKRNADEDGDEKEEFYFLYKYHAVFNLDQCEGLEVNETVPAQDLNPIERAEKVIEGFTDRPKVLDGAYATPSYNPVKDEVRMPNTYSEKESYYNDLFHEFAHSVQNERRLGLKEQHGNKKTQEYAWGELTAEMTAAMMSELCGIRLQKVADNNASYIALWKNRIKEDPNMFVKAASESSKIVDYMLGGEE